MGFIKPSKLDEISAFLGAMPISVEGELKKHVIDALSECWQSITINEHKTTPEKLYRAENMVWSHPFLTFDLERHGGLVLGSTYAEVHSWSVDLSTGTATVNAIRKRQIKKSQIPFDVKSVAIEIANEIASGRESLALDWKEPELKVVVKIGQIIPQTNKQTTASRRERFRAAIIQEMESLGWVMEPAGNVLGFRKSKIQS